MFKKLINWLRHYFSEEGKQEREQTRMYAKESSMAFRRYNRQHNTASDDRERRIATDGLLIGMYEVRMKYPKSRQAIASKRRHDANRPKSLSPEEWDETYYRTPNPPKR